MLQGDFQPQRAGVGCPGVPSVGTQCGSRYRLSGLLVTVQQTIFLAVQVKSFCLLSTLSLAHHMLPTADAPCFAVLQTVILRYCFGV